MLKADAVTRVSGVAGTVERDRAIDAAKVDESERTRYHAKKKHSKNNENPAGVAVGVTATRKRRPSVSGGGGVATSRAGPSICTPRPLQPY